MRIEIDVSPELYEALKAAAADSTLDAVVLHALERAATPEELPTPEHREATVWASRLDDEHGDGGTKA